MATRGDVIEGFGGRVRAARERAGLTPTQLAYAVGLSESGVRAIENGQSQASICRARLIADALGVSLDDLAPAGSAGETAGEKIPKKSRR